MNDCYSPHTGEHIDTTTPADWMGHAGEDAPAYDRERQGCFFRGGAWVIVDAAPPKREAQEILTELAALDAESIRPTREIYAALAAGVEPPSFSISKIAALEAQAVALRAELAAL